MMKSKNRLNHKHLKDIIKEEEADPTCEKAMDALL